MLHEKYTGFQHFITLTQKSVRPSIFIIVIFVDIFTKISYMKWLS